MPRRQGEDPYLQVTQPRLDCETITRDRFDVEVDFSEPDVGPVDGIVATELPVAT